MNQPRSDIFGQSLALMNFGIVENVTEKELDERVVGKDDAQALAKLAVVTAQTLDVQYSDGASRAVCPNRGEAKSH